MKRFFETPKRAAFSAVCLTLLALFAVGAVFAAVSITGFSFSRKEITLDRAKEIALADAGIMDSEAVFTKTKQEMEREFRCMKLNFMRGIQNTSMKSMEQPQRFIVKARRHLLRPRNLH